MIDSVSKRIPEAFDLLILERIRRKPHVPSCHRREYVYPKTGEPFPVTDLFLESVSFGGNRITGKYSVVRFKPRNPAIGHWRLSLIPAAGFCNSNILMIRSCSL